VPSSRAGEPARRARLLLAVALAWVRANRLHRLARLAGLATAVAVAWSSAVPVPGRDSVSGLVWPLAPTVVAAAVPGALVPAVRAVEALAERAAWRRRAAVVVAILALVLAHGVAAGAVRSAGVLARNGCFVLGVALIATGLLPPGGAWAAPVATSLAMWLLGSGTAGGPAEGWAVLLRPGGDAGASRAAAGALVVGAVVLVVVGPRGSRRGRPL
jgi:hypothetical protein